MITKRLKIVTQYNNTKSYITIIYDKSTFIMTAIRRHSLLLLTLQVATVAPDMCMTIVHGNRVYVAPCIAEWLLRDAMFALFANTKVHNYSIVDWNVPSKKLWSVVVKIDSDFRNLDLFHFQLFSMF